MHGNIPRQPGSLRNWGLFGTRGFIAVELDPHAELAPGEIGRFHADDMAGTAPFVSGLAADFLGHLEEDFHNFAFAHAGVRGKKKYHAEKDSPILLFLPGDPTSNADAKSSFHIVTLGETTVARKDAGQLIHMRPPGTTEGAGAERLGGT